MEEGRQVWRGEVVNGFLYTVNTHAHHDQHLLLMQ